MQWTAIEIEGISLSEFSVRGLSQSIKPSDGSRQIRRTVNGTARDISAQQFRKYEVKISCRDQEGPGLIDIWPGKLIQISCLPDVGGGLDSDYPLVLSCLVSMWNADKDEAGHLVNWDLEAVEV